MSSTGAGAALVVAKKAAERYSRELKERTMAAQSQKYKDAAARKLNDSDSFSGTVTAGAVTLGAMVTAVIQAAVQIVSSIVSLIAMILVPLAILATIISFTISLLTGISGAVDEADSWYMGGGMELVEVAMNGFRLSPVHQAIYEHVREKVPFLETDRELWPDIRRAEAMVRSNELLDIAQALSPDFE